MKRIGFLLSFIVIIITGCNDNDHNVLVIGDSISLGYTPYVSSEMSDVADVEHISENAMHTKYGVRNVENWVSRDKYDIILFNWGLWDLVYRLPGESGVGQKDKNKGIQETTLLDYKRNLDSIVGILKMTHAKLVFVTTTYVPENEPGMKTVDVHRYNKAAKEIMNKHNVAVCDIYQTSKIIHSKYGKGKDDVHYKKRGYQKLGKEIAEYCMVLLKEEYN